MKRHAIILVTTCISMFALLAGAQGQQQGQKGGDPTVSISFRNDTKYTILLQGMTKVRNGERRGSPIVIQPGKTGFDNSVPAGVRFLTIVDFNRPSRVLYKDGLPIPPGSDIALVLRLVPNTERVILLPDQQKQQDR